MRSLLASWTVGLLCVGGLAGCGFFQNCRNSCGLECNLCKAGTSKVLAEGDSSEVIETPRPTKKARSGGLLVTLDQGIRKRSNSVPVETTASLPRILSQSSEPLPPLPEIEVASEKDEPVVMPLPLKTEPGRMNITNAERIIETPRTFVPSPSPAVRIPSEVVTNLPSGEKAIELKNLKITYGHADKFASMTGQVTMYRQSLRLRYASVAQEDPYGGVVILEGAAELEKIRDGQHVRVRGELIPPTERNGAARYRVQAVEILD